MQVSVIVPAWNAQETIADTLRSLVDQAFAGWEAVIVDDGSTDATSGIVEGFVKTDPRFRLLKQQNRGESAARNAGIAQARGEWLLFLDSDDWILPRHLERLLQRVQADGELAAAYCGWAYVTPDGTQLFPSAPRQCKPPPGAGCPST